MTKSEPLKKNDDDGWHVETEDGRKITIEDFAYEMFAMAHPVEAYDHNPKRFCKYCRTKNPKLTNRIIAIMIRRAKESLDNETMRSLPPPKRIQRKRTKGWKMPPNTVYVGRPSFFGNPFYPTEKYTAQSCVDRYRKWLLVESSMTLAAAKRELKGKNLACWCKLSEPCHADILLELANGGH